MTLKDHVWVGNPTARTTARAHEGGSGPGPSTGPMLFGDLLALSRRSWIRQMGEGLARKGHGDYRPTDAAVFRRLLRGPTAVGRLDDMLGVSRQAARKVVEGLEQRSYVTTERDPADARRPIVSLTRTGQAYALAVVEVIEALNQELDRRVEPGDLAARGVLLAVIAGEGGRGSSGG